MSAYPRPAVGAVVIHAGRVLLVRRGKPPRYGLWAIPGGSVRPGEGLGEAAERELWEETGVRARAGKPVHVFELIEWSGPGQLGYHYVVVDLLADYLGGEPRAATDALEARWFTPEQVQGPEVDGETRALLQTKLNFIPQAG